MKEQDSDHDVYEEMERVIREGFKNGAIVSELKVTGRRLAKQRFETPLEQAEAWLHFINSLRDMVYAEMERIENKGYLSRLFNARYRWLRRESRIICDGDIPDAEEGVDRATGGVGK